MAIDPQKINTSFNELPSNIKSWLASEELAYAIGEINNRVGLRGEKRSIIPNLILRLAVQDLEPLNFIDELAKELEVNFEVAKTISKDIESNALRPIENELKRDLGLDVKVIYFGKPGGKPPQEVAPQEEKKPAPKDSEIYIPKETAAPAPPTQETKPEEKPAEPKVNLKTFEEISPFILHKERSEAPQRFSSEPGPKINIQTPETNQSAPKEESRPVSVEVESPSQRVVHYHQFKTPVNNLGLPKRDQN